MKLILFILGIVMILLGLVLFPLPIPLGLLFILIGIILVVSNNKWAKRLLKSARARWSWLDKFFEKAGKIIPKRFRKDIEETDPNGHDEDDEESPEESRPHTSAPASGVMMRKKAYPRYIPPARPRG